MTLQPRVSRNFQELLAWGEDGEREIAEMLIRRGNSILPLYQFTNHDRTPFLLLKTERLTMPDLSCWKEGRSYFVEVKRKRQWVRFKRKIETGLNKKHFFEYLKIKQATGFDVWLFFVHEKDMAGVYFQEIGVLLKKHRIWDGMVGAKRIEKPLILFEKDALIRLED